MSQERGAPERGTVDVDRSSTELHVERFRQLAVTLKDAADELGTLYGPIHNGVVGPPAPVAFAERLRMKIAARGVTQTELAGALGRTQTAVSYWAAGKRQPSLADVCALADYFGVTVDYLVGRSDA